MLLPWLTWVLCHGPLQSAHNAYWAREGQQEASNSQKQKSQKREKYQAWKSKEKKGILHSKEKKALVEKKKSGH
jgi:hypothetical protein